MTVRRRNAWSVGMMPTGLAQKDLDRNFLKDVAKFKIPTTEETYALGRVIQAGVHRILGARGKHISWKRLPPQTIIKHFRKKEKAAFDQMILRNLRLVIALTRRFGYAQMSEADTVTVFSLSKGVFTDKEGSVTRTTFEEMMPDHRFPSPDDETALRMDIDKMKKAMRKVLNERERTVLYLRFYKEITLNAAAAHPDMMALRDSDQALSRERVRQIQEEALSKLRTFLE